MPKSISMPSLSHTYTSECDESESFEFIPNILQDDELSFNSDNDSASFDLISHMISNDEISVESTPEYSSRNASVIAHGWVEGIEKVYPNITCESTKPISVPRSKAISPTIQPVLHSNRVTQMKNRLRSIEAGHKDQRRISPNCPIIPPTHIDSTITMRIQHETFKSRKQQKSGLSFRKTIIGTAGDIITMNCIICFLYFIYTIFQNALVQVMDESSALMML